MHNFFDGYYFKQQAKDYSLAIIPAMHIDSFNSLKSSIQIVTSDFSYVQNFNDKRITISKNPFVVEIGNNIFTQKGVILNIDNNFLQVKGTLHFGKFTKPNYDIMGPFSLVPFMECRHSLVSLAHTVNGNIKINGENFNFDNAKGYIEGDSGNSFPRKYLWTQCLFRDNSSLMLAVAKIPISSMEFTGIIACVLIDKTEYRIATYLGAKAVYISKNKVIVQQGEFTLEAQLIKDNTQKLSAPIGGSMTRIIHESLTACAFYRFKRNGKILLEKTVNNASFEFEW